MATGVRISSGHNALDQTKSWQVAGLVAPVPDRLYDDPDGTLDALGALDATPTTLCVPVSWARLEPDYGTHDGAALERYRKILEMASSRNLEPLVLLGVDWPWWMGEELWLTPGSPERFGAHVRSALEGLGPLCRRVVVCQASPVDGWVEGSGPPGRRGALADAWAVADNLLTGHLLAYETVHELVPGAVVALGMRPSTCYDWHRLMLDLVWARRLGVGRDELDPWLAGRRRAHDRCEPASSLAERAARAAAGALCPYGGGRLALGVPRRSVDTLYGGRHELAADALWLQFATRRRPWDRTPPDPARWCDDQRRLTPGAELWVQGAAPSRLFDLWIRRS